jgi:hypothetical protein
VRRGAREGEEKVRRGAGEGQKRGRRGAGEGQERGPQGAENEIRKHHRQNNLWMVVVVIVG